jgi:hypothetical protein
LLFSLPKIISNFKKYLLLWGNPDD